MTGPLHLNNPTEAQLRCTCFSLEKRGISGIFLIELTGHCAKESVFLRQARKTKKNIYIFLNENACIRKMKKLNIDIS